MSVCVECRTVAGTEFGEGRAVLARERGFFLGNVRCLEVEDSVLLMNVIPQSKTSMSRGLIIVPHGVSTETKGRVLKYPWPKK